jgi:hypothetical protein
MKSDINIRKRTASKLESLASLRDGNVRTTSVIVEDLHGRAAEAAVSFRVKLRQTATMFV